MSSHPHAPVIEVDLSHALNSDEEHEAIRAALRKNALYREGLLFTGLNVAAESPDKVITHIASGVRRQATFCFTEAELGNPDSPLDYAYEGDGQATIVVYDVSKMRGVSHLQYEPTPGNTWRRAIVAVLKLTRHEGGAVRGQYESDDDADLDAMLAENAARLKKRKKQA